MISANVATETPTAISARDLVVQSLGEPRIPDILLAVRLGFERPRKIRELIERNRSELESYGELPVRVGSPHGGANPKGGRPGNAYFLNEGQALVICALARTPVAAAIRREIIVVFQSYHAWKVRETDAPDAWRDMMVVRGLLERGVDALLDLLNFIDVHQDDEDDREGDEIEEGGEPSLGAPDLDATRVGDQTNWARGSSCDHAEQDDADYEPSLASSNERSDQTSWGLFGNDHDLEEEHDGREPADEELEEGNDDEPSLGATLDLAQGIAWAGGRQVAWAFVDGEEGEGDEPSLGSPEDHETQVGWARGSDSDRELDDSDREPNGDEDDTLFSEDDLPSGYRPVPGNLYDRAVYEALVTEAQHSVVVVDRLRVLTLKLKGKGDGQSILPR